MSMCPSCGKELSIQESSAKFCTYCGAPLTTETPVETTEAPVETTENQVTPEEPAKDAAPVNQEQKGHSINVNVDEIKEKISDVKDKALPLIDRIFEKAKKIPVLGTLLEKIDKTLYPILLAIPVALVALILVIVIVVSSSGSYMSPMKDYMKMVNKKNTDPMKLTSALAPDFRSKILKDAYKIDSLQDSLEDASDELEDMYEKIDDEFKKWKIGFDVKSKEKLSKKKIKDMQEALDDYYDEYIESNIDYYEDILDDEDRLEEYADNMDMSEKEAKSYLKTMIKYYESYEKTKITAAYEVKGRFTIKADKDDWESETVRVILVKINGDWAYAGLDDGDYISFTDDDEEISLFYEFFSLLRNNHLR